MAGRPKNSTRAEDGKNGGFDAELTDLAPEARWREWMNRIEAVLFAAPKPVEREKLARVVGRDASIDLLIDDIREELRSKPYDVVNLADGWAFRTRPAYSDAIVASAALPARSAALSESEAMVLVSIAYHQPVTKAEIAEILGREVPRDLIATLRDTGMIATGPRSPSPGAPFTYVTTKGFLGYFGLDTLRDLPDREALEDAGMLGRDRIASDSLPLGFEDDP
jgi:segregation and condensation protein B